MVVFKDARNFIGSLLNVNLKNTKLIFKDLFIFEIIREPLGGLVFFFILLINVFIRMSNIVM